jgi:cell division protease FtsH
LGREINQTRNISERLAETIDNEVRSIIVSNYNRGVEILQSKMEILHAMSAALLERETLEREEIELLMAGKPLPAFVPQKHGMSDSGGKQGNEAASILLPLPGSSF